MFLRNLQVQVSEIDVHGSLPCIKHVEDAADCYNPLLNIFL
jgi:hypothetical protein